MSFALPPGFQTIIGQFLVGCGDEVVFTPQAGGAPLTLRGSVQRPATATFTGDAIQEGFLVYLPGDAFPPGVRPARFDRLTVYGEDRAIEEAVPIEAGGLIHAWQLRVLG